MPPTPQPDNPDSLGPRKRPRLDEGDPDSWTRHPNLYIQDGTIVLLAGDTVFRTYGGLLSKHSEVFSGMSSLSSHQPQDAETYDGCPLVRLSDSSEDLGYFLEAFVDFNFFPDSKQAIPFRVVAGILRLATKYIVPPLRKRATAHLSRAFPWGREVDPLSKLANSTIFGSLEGTPHPFELLSLIRECRVNKLIPRAFLQAGNKGPDALLNGDRIGDKIFHLREEDARIAVLGQNHLHVAVLQTHIRLGFLILESRCSHMGCDSSRRKTLKNILDRHARTPTVTLRLTLHPESGICAPCAVCWATLFQDEINKIWAQIPGYFGLPGWRELQEDEN